jgi:hypothetical protein
MARGSTTGDARDTVKSGGTQHRRTCLTEGRMSTGHVSAEAAIAAPADRVYRILANYREHHTRILPPAFTDVVVEEGGIGAGTIIRFKLRAGGRTQEARQRVEEPEPGRVLLERDLDRDMTTTFTVTPDGNDCRVRIETVWTSSGLQGFMERLLAPRLLRPIYKDELARLDRYAREQTGA